MTNEERFWSKVDRRGRYDCWPWLATITPQGYGSFAMDGRSHPSHRVAYELLRGPIPDGLVIDHLCRVRHCVNPAHMEPVTNAENIRRGVSPSAIHARVTACPQGHQYTPENTEHRPSGRRHCLTCRRAASAVRRTCPNCGQTIARAVFTRHLRREARRAA